MRIAFGIAIPLGIFLTIVAWRLSQLLSPDAIAMVVGLFLGVFAGVPAMALVAMARRRDKEDDDLPPITIDYPHPVVYRDEVTPFTHLARRGMKLEPLPERQANHRQVQIDVLRAALDALENENTYR